MSVCLTVVGAVVVLAVAIATAAGSVMAAAGAVRRARERRDTLVRSDEARRLGRQLYGDAHWFGENVECARLLQIIAITLLHHANYDVDRVREQWRRGEDAEVPA